MIEEMEDGKAMLDDDSDKENEESQIIIIKKKAGRKSQWEEIVDDLFNIILENEQYTRKLLLTNTKKVRNAECMKYVLSELRSRCIKHGCDLFYNVWQTKAKIKRCQKICRLAAMTVKTSSGIKRFQEEKCLGKWFNKLLPVVMSAPNCQPDLATEPGQLSATPARSQEDENSDSTSGETFCTIIWEKTSAFNQKQRTGGNSRKN